MVLLQPEGRIGKATGRAHATLPTTSVRGEALLASLVEQALEPEEELAPQYAASTQQGLGPVWKAWTQFCALLHERGGLESPDLVVNCRSISLRKIEGYLEWYCATHVETLRKASSLRQERRPGAWPIGNT
ncbi:hypothetical protein MMC13_006943 [Lambiella insularis]|nr:hypothetical protein [Lambiella insularis]